MSVSHFFTVDVEDYFHVSAMESVAPRSKWDTYPSRVEGSTLELLELMERYDARGTFFILGWVAERFPGLVKRIAAGGHEIASHGFDHKKVTSIGPDEFRESIRRSRRVLEDVSGERVLGFRAPSFSIVPGREWAFDVLLEEGYVYDSSLFPIRRPDYGYPDAPRDRHEIPRQAGVLQEFPPATLLVGGVALPAAGGGYLRLLPDGLIAAALRQAERRDQPGTFYIHPWEIDPGQPRLPVGLVTRIRHYAGLRRAKGRIERLLRSFRFDSIASSLVRDRGPAAAGGLST